MAKTKNPTNRSRAARQPSAPTTKPAANEPQPPATAPSGKLGKVVELLKRPEGITAAAISAATGWQIHSVRGAMSGA